MVRTRRIELWRALRARLSTDAGCGSAAQRGSRSGDPRMGERSSSACSRRRVREDARRLRHQRRSFVGWSGAMTAIARILLVAVVVLWAGDATRADEFKPGYLQLTQIARETYDVLWKIPAID